jgi:hypothetical protein
MARKADTPCARCGALLWRGSTSLPPGQMICQPCRRLARPGSKHTGSLCLVCREGRLAPGARTCSRQCGQRARYANRIPARQCEVCGARFDRTYSKQRTCGRACGWELRVREGNIPKARPKPPVPLKPQEPRSCAHCGTSHTTARVRYCSDSCAQAASRARNLARYGKTVNDADRCGGCGERVPFKRKRCDKCKERAAREAKRRKRRAEKARRRGVVHEKYTLAEIAQRDRRTCQLCRRRVAMTKPVPHPKAPTIDHVLPIAAGGQDVRANVQLAHFQCNWMKSDGGTQQLALVG